MGTFTNVHGRIPAMILMRCFVANIFKNIDNVGWQLMGCWYRDGMLNRVKWAPS